LTSENDLHFTSHPLARCANPRKFTLADLPATDTPPRDMTELVRDWLGPEADVDGKNWLIVVNPLEVRRLSATYKHVANLPADYSGPEEQAYLIDGRELFGGSKSGK
jgi:hypothetical protein